MPDNSSTDGMNRNEHDGTEQLRELQNEMLEERVDLSRVYGEYVHVGFGASDARVVVTEETPSLKHFTAYREPLNRLYGGFDNMTAEDYADFYVNREKTGTRDWPPFEALLDPVFTKIEGASTDLFNDIYMASVVKNPVQYDNKHRTIPAAWSDTWHTYLPKETEIIQPRAVVAVGKYAVAYTLSMLSEKDLEPTDVKMKEPGWWGEPSFDTDRPVYRIPHWKAKQHHPNIQRNWDDLLDELRLFLQKYAY
jgi:hypothetical protein